MNKVEKIIDRRNGKPHVEYWVKWKGLPYSKNTWVSDICLDCKDLIQQFELSRRDMEKPSTSKGCLAKSSTKNRRSVTTKVVQVAHGSDCSLEAEKILGATTKVVQEPSLANGSDRGSEAEKILGAIRRDGELYYITKFEDMDQPECVHKSEARASFGEMLIDYLEEHIMFWSSDDESDPRPQVSPTTKQGAGP